MNTAKKASAGAEPFVYDSKLKRMKLTCEMYLSDSVTAKRVGMDAYYSLPLGPHMVASDVIVIAGTVNILQASGKILD